MLCFDQNPIIVKENVFLHFIPSYDSFKVASQAYLERLDLIRKLERATGYLLVKNFSVLYQEKVSGYRRPEHWASLLELLPTRSSLEQVM